MLGNKSSGSLNVKNVKSDVFEDLRRKNSIKNKRSESDINFSSWFLPSINEFHEIINAESTILGRMSQQGTTNYISLFHEGLHMYGTSTVFNETKELNCYVFTKDSQEIKILHKSFNVDARPIRRASIINFTNLIKSEHGCGHCNPSSNNKNDIRKNGNPSSYLPEIGDALGGGVVFYISSSYVYIVAMRNVSNWYSNSDKSFNYGCIDQDFSINTSELTGSGYNNTQLLLSECSENTVAKVCADFVAGPDATDDTIVNPEPEETIVEVEGASIPITFHVLNEYEKDLNGDYVSAWDQTASDGYFWNTLEFTQQDAAQIVHYLNQMLNGTYQTANWDGNNTGVTGPAIYDPNHGERFRYNVVLNQYIPSNFYKYFLHHFDDYRIDYDENNGLLKKNSMSIVTTDVTADNSNSYYNEFVGAQNNINTALSTAQTNYNNALAAQQALTGSESQEATDAVNQKVIDTEKILSYGGFLKFDGYINYNILQYYNRDKISQKAVDLGQDNNIDKSSKDPFYRMSLELESDNRLASSFLDSTSDQEISCAKISAAIPGLNVWIYNAGFKISRGWTGLGDAPNYGDAYGGTCYMSTRRLNKSPNWSKREFASILLHEIGHVYGLAHSFYGGNIWLKNGKTKPEIETPIWGDTIHTSDNEQIQEDQHTDATASNTLNFDEVTFINLFHEKALPSFTRGLRHSDLIDESKNFSTYFNFHRRNYTDSEGNVKVIKSVNTSPNEFMDFSIAGENNFDNLLASYGYRGFSYIFRRLNNAHYASQDLPFFWTGSYFWSIDENGAGGTAPEWDVEDYVYAPNKDGYSAVRTVHTAYGSREVGDVINGSPKIDRYNEKISAINANIPSGGRINVINYTVMGDTAGVNFKTRVPFCVPDENGNPTDDYDEFWMYKLNWLNDNYRLYPDNWPTTKMYDEFDDDGNPLCPCLYKDQYYSKTLSKNDSVANEDHFNKAIVLRPTPFRTPGSENSDQTDINSKHTKVREGTFSNTKYEYFGYYRNYRSNRGDWSNLMNNFFTNRDDNDYEYQSGNYSYTTGKDIMSIFMQGRHFKRDSNNIMNWFGSSWYDDKNIYGSLNSTDYANNYNELKHVTSKSGFIPEFGFSGFTGRQQCPDAFVLTQIPESELVPGTNLINFYAASTWDDGVQDNYSLGMAGFDGDSVFMGLIIRSTYGSTDPNSEYYNPFKIDLSSFTEDNYKRNSLISQLISDRWDYGSDPNPVNPFNNYNYLGQTLTTNFFKYTMFYGFHLPVAEWDEGRYITDHVTMQEYIDEGYRSYKTQYHDTRSVISPDGLHRMHDYIDLDVEKLGETGRTAELYHRESSNLLNDYGSLNGEETRDAIEKYLND